MRKHSTLSTTAEKRRQESSMRTTLAVCLVLTMTAWNVMRLWTAVAWKEMLDKYAPNPGWIYVASTGAFWTAIGLALAWAFWRRIPWARWTLLTAAFAYIAWGWADRLLLQSQAPTNWLFALIITLLALGCVAFITLEPRKRPFN